MDQSFDFDDLGLPPIPDWTQEDADQAGLSYEALVSDTGFQARELVEFDPDSYDPFPSYDELAPEPQDSTTTAGPIANEVTTGSYNPSSAVSTNQNSGFSPSATLEYPDLAILGDDTDELLARMTGPDTSATFPAHLDLQQDHGIPSVLGGFNTSIPPNRRSHDEAFGDDAANEYPTPKRQGSNPGMNPMQEQLPGTSISLPGLTPSIPQITDQHSSVPEHQEIPSHHGTVIGSEPDLPSADAPFDDHSKLLLNFKTSSTLFRYDASGQLKDIYTGDQLNQFIYERPTSRRLTVWIRRCAPIPTKGTTNGHFPECICAECPIRNTKNAGFKGGPIAKGEYMVAFDEFQAYRSEKNIDPHAVSGHIHFYCLERFVGLLALSRWTQQPTTSYPDPNVVLQVDSRESVNHVEGDWKFSVSQGDVAILQQWFDSCVAGNGVCPVDYPSMIEFRQTHGSFARSVLKCLHKSKFERLRPWEKRRATARSGSQKEPALSQHVHMGDLEVLAAAKTVAAGHANQLSATQQLMLQRAKAPWLEHRAADAQ